MSEINAVIAGIGAYVPEYILTNQELCTMVETTDEWITTRVGIKERRILKDDTKGASYLGVKALENLFAKTGTKPEDIDFVICATSTPDHIFPSTASIIAEAVGIKGALAIDIQAACSGFITALEMATAYIKSGKYKKIIVVSAEKMSYMTDYQDRATAPLFGDAAGCVLIEPTTENIGIMDSIMRTDGVGTKHLLMKSGGSASPASHETVERREHFVHQEGQAVFKHAVLDMAEVSAEVMERNNLNKDNVAWLVPHQANLRIIDAVAQRTELDYSKILINIENYGNTSSASIPLCMWENEEKFKKGDNIILTAFGAGFTFGAVYLKWGY
ncbi:MAG: ketoacyl-ACP synthase III [Prevotellaceae bacterium]|jgi:3-oxoacyl-[acyl-carrier-protein] synthase-3|nr:ketoacyl-ACP synthase III [Prevotellaceae bacterium]